MRRWWAVSALVLAFGWLTPLLLVACGQTVEVGIDDPRSGGGSASGAGGTGGLVFAGNSAVAGDGAGGAFAGAGACVVTPCRGKAYACGDCIDNDLDGAIDALDPECLGPCDNDELGLGTGLPGGQSAACRQDCYFDGDSGPGNDQCEWSHACDQRSVAPDYPPSGEARCAYDAAGLAMGIDCEAASQMQPAACLDECLPLVPNGCDCFGCCELPAESGEFRFVGRGGGSEPGCALEVLDDPSLCPRCSPVPSCLNPCDACEACVGRGRDRGCEPGTACPGGRAECSAEQPCSVGDYCVTGCCVQAPKPT